MSVDSEKTNESPALIAYAVGQEHLRLVPAPSSREWMDQTHQHFANRCLPMLMANQSGWLLVVTRDVSVVWNGGQGKEAMSISTDGELPGQRPAVSIFGHGILTWHIPYLFRTPPGFNLLVRGPSNWPRDNACALEGLVETDWAVATFTMNYKILRPNEPVHFRAGEPVCMIVPQRRGELESFHPFIQSVQDNPDVAKGYQLWARSRAEFLKSLSQPREQAARGALWQKHYFRGTAPDGTIGGAHQTRRELGGFEKTEAPEAFPIDQWPRELAASRLGINLSYVICSSPRSGSTLLAEALESTRLAGRPDEYFDVHPEIEALMRRRLGAVSDPIHPYLLKVLQQTKTQNGVFGWKAHWHQYQDFWKRLMGMPLSDPALTRGTFGAVFPNLRYVWLRRRDRLRQAISYGRAMQTDVWRSYVGRSAHPKGAAAFDKSLVDARIDEIDRMEQGWEEFFARHGIAPLVIWYEDFVADYENTVRGVLAHLEIRLPEDFAFPPPRLRKQSDQETERWVELYGAPRHSDGDR